MQPTRVAPPAAAIIVAFAVPFLVSKHTLPLATFYGEWTAALLCVALISILTVWQRGFLVDPAHTSIPWIALAPLWVIAITIAQGTAGMTDVTGTRFTTQTVLTLGTLMMVVAWQTGQRLASDEREHIVDALAIALLVAGLLGTLAQWIQLFRLESSAFGLVSAYFYDTNRRLWGNLNQPNHQATVEGLALAASVWLAARGKLRFPAWLAAALLLESGVVLCGSRTGVLHVGIAVIYALIAALFARKQTNGAQRMQRPQALVASAIVMAVLMLTLIPSIRVAGEAFDWRLFDAVSQMQAHGQLSARGALWAHAVGMFRTHPWLGVGFGEFGWAQFQQMAQLGIRVEMSLHAHNAVLDLLAKTGAVGTVGVIVALLAWLWRVARARIVRGHLAERQQTLLVLVWLTMIGAHSMLEYPLHYLYFFLPCCFLLGWLDTAGFGRRRTGRASRGIVVIGFVVISAGFLVTLWQDYARLEAREYADRDRVDAMPMPSLWFQAPARGQVIEHVTITPDNAHKLLPLHIEAVHVLPMPEMIGRTAWLFALTGEPDRGKLWLERLRFYYQGDEANQFAAIDKACASVDAAERPRDFCTWIHAKSRAFSN